MSTIERRRSTRHTISLVVTLRVGGAGRVCQGKSVDISKSGIFVVVSEHIPEGRRVDLVIDTPVLKTSIATSGIVVHAVQGVGLGLRFSHQSAMTERLIIELVDYIKSRAREDPEPR